MCFHFIYFFKNNLKRNVDFILFFVNSVGASLVEPHDRRVGHFLSVVATSTISSLNTGVKFHTVFNYNIYITVKI